MDAETISQLLLILFLLLCSAFFSASETAFTSVNRFRLHGEAERGNRPAKRVLALQERYDEVLSTVLVGNNIVNLGASAVATMLFLHWFPRHGGLIATMVMTIVVLLASEITPKNIAKAKSEQVAKASARLIYALMVVGKPIIWLLAQWTRLIHRLFKLEADDVISEADLSTLVAEAGHSGSLELEEQRLVQAAMAFDDVTVEGVLTHRLDVVAIPLTASPTEVQEVFHESRLSRLLVYQEQIDEVVGVLNIKDFYELESSSQPLHWQEQLSEPLNIPRFMTMAKALQLMRQEMNHFALVRDEHGGLVGIVTMEDLLEALVGEIWDEHDQVRQAIVEVVPGEVYRLAGDLPIGQFERYFHCELPKQDRQTHTLSGFINASLERLPDVGDTVTIPEGQFEVETLIYDRAQILRFTCPVKK